MFIVNSPQERVRLAHKSLKQVLIQNYRDLSKDANHAKLLASIPKDLQPKAFKKEVYKEGLFTADWFTHNILQLYQSLTRADRKFDDYLEIGSFEGLSTCWMARFQEIYSDSPSITAIDIFGKNSKHGNYGKHFDKNISNFIKNIEVMKIQSHSTSALANLKEKNKEFDMVYVDGSHYALNVIIDASLCWQMLRDMGVIVFNDYYWFEDKNSKNVLHGVNAFLDLIEGEYKVLNVYHQVVLQKLQTTLPVNVF